MWGLGRYATISAIGLLLTGCSTLYEYSVDPGETVPVESVLKSLRCEMMTFFEVNRLRTAIYEYNIDKIDFKTNFGNYAYLDIDPTKYGSIDATFKTIDTLGLSLGMDWKTNIDKGGRSHDWHIGPALTGTKTYNREVLFAVPQDGRLGSDFRQANGAVPVKDSSPLADPGSEDRDFFCYLQTADILLPNFKSTNIRDIYARLEFMEALTRHELPVLENFHRIMINGDKTLANWFELVGAESARGEFSAHKLLYVGAILPGQVNYSFALEIKPSFDLKYTLVATVINPYVPDASISRDSTGTFQIFLNMTHAAAALGGKQGTAVIAQAPKSAAWGPVADKEKNRTVTAGSGYAAPQRPPLAVTPGPSTYGKRAPGYRLESPLPLPLPPPP